MPGKYPCKFYTLACTSYLNYVSLLVICVLFSEVTADRILNERCDGNRNILHACVFTSFPTTTNKEVDAFDPLSSASEFSAKDSLLNSFSWPAGTCLDDVSGDLFRITSSKPLSSPASIDCLPSEANDRSEVSLTILKAICQCNSLTPTQLRILLSSRDSNGQTPFMLSVSGKAYKAAGILFDVIQNVAKAEASVMDKRESNSHELKRIMNSMIFPIVSNSDDSPLHVLCYNDTCSFTWTGENHINQDIYECKTCALTDTLCCCTECARVCHKGHDCSLKQTPHTAYCDCWKKCKCKSVKAGPQNARFELLRRLIEETDLVNYSNGRGENLLLFLLQTVRRQVKEQKEWLADRASYPRKVVSKDESDHHMSDNGGSPADNGGLEPPKFSRKALEYLFDDWRAVRAMIMTGYRESDDFTSYNSLDGGSSSLTRFQGHTAHLDKFTHCLLVKLSSQVNYYYYNSYFPCALTT